MKKTTKFLCTILMLAIVMAFFAVSVPAAQADEIAYQAYKLKPENLLYPSHYYENADCTGIPVKHTFIKIPSGYPSFGCDNNKNSGLTSKPIKFNDLVDNGGSKVPTCVIDLALGGEPIKVLGFGMTLRSHFDCEPLHVKIQVSSNAAGTQWTTVYEEDDIKWESLTKRWFFAQEVDAYMIRLLVLDLDEVNLAQEGTYYDPIQGDETRFAYSEVYVLTKRTEDTSNSGSSSGSTSSTRPTSPSSSGSTTTGTRPAFTIPVSGGQTATTAPTQAPTQAATKAPTQAATQAPTQAATQAPTQGATTAPTQPATQGTSTAPTDATSAPTEPVGTVDPTTTETVEPNAPAETTPEVTEPTNEPTVEATVAPTTGETTDTNTDNGAQDAPKDNSLIIIIAIAAAAVIAGVVVFVIIKKKKA